MTQNDFFNTQLDFLGAAPAQSYAPDLEKVRAELLKVLDEARTAEVLPWPEKKLAYWRLVFPQMTNWLPEQEGAQLRFEFEAQIARLAAA
ncbi:MAG: hypothetical protein M5U16_15170 [Hyphomicrobium sp.]|nr:hypothetical protein [Hyphomicrobium sp.]